MSDKKSFRSEDDGENQKMAAPGKAEAGNGIMQASLRNIVYSTLVLATFLLIGVSVVVHILTATIRRESEKIIIATSAVLEDIVQILAKDAAPAGNSIVVGAKQTAAGQRALDLGKKSLKTGQIDKAMLYFINGVNHDPSRMELVQCLAETALKSGSKELEDRASGILELATMQVAPDDMSILLDRIAELRAKTAQIPAPKLSPTEANKKIQELSAMYAPNLAWKDSAKVDAGLSEIEFFQQMIDISRRDSNDNNYSAAVKKSAELAINLQRIQGSIPLFQYVSKCVVQMKAIAEADAPDLARFSSVNASAQGVLAQIWGGMDGLPPEMQRDINATPAFMRMLEEKLQENTSMASYTGCLAKLTKAETDQAGLFTDRIQRLVEAMEYVATQVDFITSMKLRLNLFERIKKSRKILAELELNRRSAYQEWALTCVNGFMKEWNMRTIGTDKLAQGLFHNHQVAMIDETILVPEVARVLNRVMTCITGELDAKLGSEAEYQMAARPKMRLEDF